MENSDEKDVKESIDEIIINPSDINKTKLIINIEKDTKITLNKIPLDISN